MTALVRHLGRFWAAKPLDSAMRMRGLEPPRGCPHTDLNRARLPIPPHPRGRQCSRGCRARPGENARTMRDLRRLATLIAVLALLALPGASALARPSGDDLVEVVVTLSRPPLAQASTEGRWLSSTRTRGRLSLRAPA